MRKLNDETWIKARAFTNRNPNHKGRRGIYRSTVTRPHSPQETRVQNILHRVAVAIGARPAPRYAHA